MPQLKGLIFDLDGTLIDSAPDLFHALNLMLDKRGRRLIALDEMKAMIGDGMLTLMQRALAATGGPVDREEMLYFKDFVTFYRAITPDPAQIYPHVVDILTRYSKAGVKLGVCTNKPTETTADLLDKLGLLPFFASVAGGDKYEIHKPNPQHLLNVIDEMEVEVTGCVMIGDGKNDVLAARGAGVPGLILTLGYDQDYDAFGADVLINGFDEIPTTLEKLGYCIA